MIRRLVSAAKQWLVPVSSTVAKPPERRHGRASAADNLKLTPVPKDLPQIVDWMRADYQVAFCERIVVSNISAVQVTISVEDGDERAEALAGELQKLWDKTVSAMLDSFAYGRVAFEKSLGYSDAGFHYPDKLEALPYRETRLRLDPDGRYEGIDVKTKSGEWEPLLGCGDSWWLALDATANNPHGKSRFLPAPFEVWKDKKGAKENRRRATRKGAMRGPIIQGPIVDTDEQTGKQFDVLGEMAPAVDTWSDGGVMLVPNDQHPTIENAYKYTVIQPDMQGFDPNFLNVTIDRLDIEMARAFGIAEQTIMEGDGHGTYGSITQKMLLLFALCEEILGQFVASFQRYVIDPTVEMNAFPAGVKITASFVPLTKRPDAFVFEVVKLLLANPAFIEGVLSGGVDVRQLLEQAGLPVTEQLEALLQAAAQRLAAATPGAVPGVPGQQSGEFGSLGRRQWQNNRKAVRDVLDDLIAGKTSEAMASELLQMLGMTPDRAAAFIQDAKDGTVEDPELQEPAALAQVVIPRQGFKVPQASQVVNAGLREFDRLYAELVDAMVNGATAATLNGIRRQILSTEANMRIAGRVLGMLSPWQPRVNTYADGAAADETDGLKVMADTPYRFPWIKSAVDFLESVGVTTSKDFAAMALADVHAVEREDAIDSGKRLRTIQKRLSEAIERGDDLRTFRKAIEGETALSRSQTETLYRTMTKRGYVEGFDRAMKSPVVAAEFPAVLFTATPDARVRDDHWDIDGVVVLRSDRAAYNALRKASQDYNCRCSLIPLSADEAEQRGVKTYGDLPQDVKAKYG